MYGVKAALLSLCLAAPAAADIASARYAEPTDRYGHGAVPGGEYGALEVTLTDGTRLLTRVSGGVFEDTAPRLHDFDGDGTPEIVAVFSGDTTGAMIRVYGLQDGMLTALGNNAPIGTRFRWLAVAGMADFNGDGLDEIAYVDRPHLARRLRLVTVDVTHSPYAFREIASVGGLTNHKYGSPDIEGGIRVCPSQPPVIITASANWSRVMEARLVDGEFQIAPVGKYEDPGSLEAALRCD
ncbi:Repeat domain-containing protein [Aliiroseovarius halocynthiae]|uniref:VCBS repeat-containing protein n=1 Tax=Aliiroseovarius halocynthiae TaxID=985055 RepID=A0A545STU5_9RHOB|nr:VCBS repeat-containing protein [Aliiroseovarius halocynthiae]TQV68380.1 VCBS repeat-containing protein [Aliiroseovarius halocynthiae]SMR70770.1 Repeat domain-containing protein [Aliiroseovarius halocynthiae]